MRVPIKKEVVATDNGGFQPQRAKKHGISPWVKIPLAATPSSAVGFRQVLATFPPARPNLALPPPPSSIRAGWCAWGLEAECCQQVRPPPPKGRSVDVRRRSPGRRWGWALSKTHLQGKASWQRRGVSAGSCERAARTCFVGVDEARAWRGLKFVTKVATYTAAAAKRSAQVNFLRCVQPGDTCCVALGSRQPLPSQLPID